MTIYLVSGGVVLFLIGMVVLLARKWGKSSVTNKMNKDTTDEVIRILKEVVDSDEKASHLDADALRDRLREHGLYKDD